MTSAEAFFWGVNSKLVLSWLAEEGGFYFWEEERNLSSWLLIREKIALMFLGCGGEMGVLLVLFGVRLSIRTPNISTDLCEALETPARRSRLC